MASWNCISSCTWTTGPIGSLFVQAWPIWSPLRCLKEFPWKSSGVSQNGRRRPQKGKTTGISLELGHFHPWYVGWQTGNPLKVGFSKNLRPQRPLLLASCGHLMWKSLRKLNYLSWRSCDRCHLIYRQASLAPCFATGHIHNRIYWKMLSNIFGIFWWFLRILFERLGNFTNTSNLRELQSILHFYIHHHPVSHPRSPWYCSQIWPLRLPHKIVHVWKQAPW